MRFVLAALALLPLAASAAPTVVVPAPALLAACAEVGTHELKWPNGSSTVTSCKRFWQQGTRPAIRVPDDTARVVYGTVADYALPGGGTGGGGLTPGTGGGGSLPPLGGGRLRGRQSTPPTDNTPTTEFWTRAGKALSVKNGIVPADADRRDFSQIIFKGYVNAKGVVTRIEPAIFIETEAVLRPHMNTFYGGIVENWWVRGPDSHHPFA